MTRCDMLIYSVAVVSRMSRAQHRVTLMACREELQGEDADFELVNVFDQAMDLLQVSMYGLSGLETRESQANNMIDPALLCLGSSKQVGPGHL
jgi:hypothetical protein